MESSESSSSITEKLVKPSKQKSAALPKNKTKESLAALKTSPYFCKNDASAASPGALKSDQQEKKDGLKNLRKRRSSAKSDGTVESQLKEKKVKINLQQFNNDKAKKPDNSNVASKQRKIVKNGNAGKKSIETKNNKKQSKNVSKQLSKKEAVIETRNGSDESDSDFEEVNEKTKKKKPKGALKQRSKKVEAKNESDYEKAKKKTRKRKMEAKIASKPPSNKVVLEAKSDESDESESDWEEVKNLPSTSACHQVTNNVRTLEITLEAPKRKETIDMEKMIKRAVNKFKKETRENMHRLHLLLFIAHGIWLSKMSNNRLIQSLSLSMVPIGFCNLKPNEFNVDSLKRFVKWFRSAFVLFYQMDFEDLTVDMETNLAEKIATKTVHNYRELALIFVAMVRSLSIDARLVISVQPYSLKDNSTQANGSDSKSLSTASNQKTKTSLKQSKQDAKQKSKRTTETAEKVETETKKESVDCNHWAEVYLEVIEKWISVNFVSGSVEDPYSLQETCSQPVSYVFAFDSENAVKDVTSRYCKNFTSPNVRRLRLKDEWYERTLKLFKTRRQLRDRLEELELNTKLSEMPFPKTVSEFKNHPLYVLKRDLLKFQGIYPADTKPLGFIRNEPIYPRSAVHMLHSKETWRKEARMVRQNEEPVKIVKARPKQHVPKEQQADRPLPLFGIWQTDIYVPPPAVDGIVPRNEYGNVELFKPSMLPPGTVYLHHPGLLQVAKKLDIDCAPAMVGWDFHAGGSHPVLEGWVVCEEFKETLIAAWDQEQAIIAEREIQRKSKRALQNWKKLTKGLLLREKVRKKFAYHHHNEKYKEIDAVSSSCSTIDQNGDVLSEPGPSCSLSWPQCRMDFTFEKDDSEVL